MKILKFIYNDIKYFITVTLKSSICTHFTLCFNLLYIFISLVILIHLGVNLGFLIILYAVYIYIEVFKIICQKIKNMNKLYGIPISEKRYTKKDQDGNIIMSESDVILAMSYLSELEDYIEKEVKAK